MPALPLAACRNFRNGKLQGSGANRLRCLPLVRLPYLLQIRKLEEAGFWLCNAQKNLA